MNILKGFIENVTSTERLDHLAINLVGQFPHVGENHRYKIVLREDEINRLLHDHVLELIILDTIVNKEEGFITFDKSNNRFFRFPQDSKQDFAKGFLRMTDIDDKFVLLAIKGFKKGYFTIIIEPNDKQKDINKKLKDTQINIIFKEK